MRVLRSPDGPLGETDAAVRAITFDDLLTHRAGLTYSDLKRLVFDPLGTKDIGFVVPHEDRHRRAAAHGFDDVGRLIKLSEWEVTVARPPSS